MGEAEPRIGHLAVGDLLRRMLPERVDPPVADPVRELLLLAPQHGVGQVVGEGLAQNPLLDPAGGHLGGRIDGHGHVQELLVEEGDAGLDAPRGRRLVRAQTVELVQPVELADGLLVEGAGVGGAVEVKVAAEDLVRPFAGKDHLDAEGADAAGHQVHGGGGAHGGDVEGLKVVDDVGEGVESLLDGEVELVVDGADVVGDELGGGQVRRALQTDAEGMEAGPPRLGAVVVLDAMAGVALGHGGDDIGTISWASESVTFVFGSRNAAIPLGSSVVLEAANGECSGATCEVGYHETGDAPAGESAREDTITVMVTAANGYNDHVYSLLVSRQNPAGNDIAAANIARADTTGTHTAVDAGTDTDGFTFTTTGASSVNLIFTLETYGDEANENAYCAQRVSVRATGGNAIPAQDDDDDDVCPDTRYRLSASAGNGTPYTVTITSEDGETKDYSLRVIDP